MPSWQKPTEQAISEALRIIARTEEQRYFFDRLTNPLWIDALFDANALIPPAPVATGDGYRYPHWPPASFIARVARDHPDHQQLATILLSLSTTDNVSIQRDLLRAMAALEPAVLPPLLMPVRNWLSTSWRVTWIIDEVGDLLTSAIGDARSHAGCRAVLEALFAPQWREFNELLGKRASSRMNEWEAEQFARKVIPVVVQTDPMLMLSPLCTALANLLSELREAPRLVAGLKDDHSIIWYQEIGTANHLNDAEDVLTFLASQVLDAIVESEHPLVEQTVRALEAGGWLIHERLAMRFLARTVAGGGYSDEIGKRLLNPDLAGTYQTRSEYDDLLAAAFGLAPADDQMEIISALRAAAERRDDERRDIWLYGRLARIEPHLPAGVRTEFARLRERFGELTDSRPFTIVEWSGVQSPLTSEAAAAMTAPELAAFCGTWQAPDDARFMNVPSWEGLASTIQTEAARRPSEFAEHSAAFAEVDPSVVRGLLAGLKTAVTSEEALSWEPLLPLLKRVVGEHDVVGHTPGSPLDRDPDWTWAQREALEFIEAALNANPEADIGIRDPLWEVIATAATECPTPADTHEEEERDAVFLAMKSTRSIAIYAAVELMLWLRRRGVPEIAPEEKALLETALDPMEETFVGMRAAVAHRLPQLAYLDWTWLGSVLPSLFPDDAALKNHWEAAWQAYVLHASPLPTPEVIAALEPFYERAINEIPPDYTPRDGFGDPVVRLGEHLVFMTLNGEWPPSHPLLTHFFHAAPASVRARVMDWLGRGAFQGTPTEEWSQHAREFYEWREQDATERGADRAELRSLGWLVAAEHFSASWWGERLPRVLRQTSHSARDYIPVEEMMARVASEAGDLPEMALEVLELLIEQSEWGWHQPYLTSAETILRVAVSVPELEKRARQVADRLARAGHDQFEGISRPYPT